MNYTYVLIILLQTQVGFSPLQTMTKFEYHNRDNLVKCEKLQEQAEEALQSREDIKIVYSGCIPGAGYKFGQ